MNGNKFLTCLLGFSFFVFFVLVSTLNAAPEKEGVSLTVYNNNFSVVKEVRKINLDKGLSTFNFTDVAKLIDPTSVHFKSITDPTGTTVLEQNYEFDLVSADKLLDKYIDREIAVITKDGSRFKGKLLSFDRNQLVIQSTTGPIHMVQRVDNIKNIEFSKLPDRLLTRPTLVWKIATKRPGEHLAQVTYQTSGMSWKADYNVLINADDTQMDLSGWVTLTNRTGVAYNNANIKLIAGDVRKIQPPRPVYRAKNREMMADSAMGGGGGFVEKSFFEYHMYTLGRQTTVNNNQVKQIELITATKIPIIKRYIFEPNGKHWHRRYGDSNAYKVNVYVEFKNDKQSNMGMPLPKGKIRAYKRDTDGEMEFVGEDQIDHTPKDEQVRLYIGDAFDLVGEKKVMDRKSGRSWRTEKIEIELRNHKDSDAVIRVREHLGHGTWTITNQSYQYKKIDAKTIEFDVPVEANGKTKLTYSIDYRW